MKNKFYVPFDITAHVIEKEEGIQRGDPCRIDALKGRGGFAWMRGHVNGWYGWPSDGKSTFSEFLTILKARVDGWKFCMFKPEDMDTVRNSSGEAEIKANAIYKNLAWMLTGKPWDAQYAEINKVQPMTEEEEDAALKLIKKHIFVIYPDEREVDALLDCCMYMYKTYKIDAFWWDPWNEVELSNEDRGDDRLTKPFRKIKKFAMKTDTNFNLVSHPKSMMDVKEKDGSFKVVNQFMQLGGAGWDIKMDGQFSIHRPFRHRDPNDPWVHFYNLKQKQAERVGVKRGVADDIMFDELKRCYYFNGINPMDGTVIDPAARPQQPAAPAASLFSKRKKKTEPGMFDNRIHTIERAEKVSDDTPF